MGAVSSFIFVQYNANNSLSFLTILRISLCFCLRSVRTSCCCASGSCLSSGTCRPTPTGPTSFMIPKHTGWVCLWAECCCYYGNCCHDLQCWHCSPDHVGGTAGLWSHERIWSEFHRCLHRGETLKASFSRVALWRKGESFRRDLAETKIPDSSTSV